MTPQEIAEARPLLLDFTAEMLGGLPRKDQRAAGELYVRGLLTDGQRKSMQPMAARLGTDHQRLQQFITSSTWDYVAVRRHPGRRRRAVGLLDEMAGPGGWGVRERVTAAGHARPVAVADAGYGDNTTFRLELENRDWQYVVAVRGTTSAYADDAQPVARSLGGGPGRPPKPAYPAPPANLRPLAIASADKIGPGTWPP